MQIRLTQDFFDTAKAEAGAERSIFWDERQPGFGLMVTAKGAKSFVVQYRAGHVSRRMTLKKVLKVDDARKQARGFLGQAAKGGDPLADQRKKEGEAANAFKAICEEYLKREGKGLRSADQRRAALERLVYPKFGTRQIDTIRRSEIVTLLDKIEDKQGPVMADRVLAYVRKIMNWHATRSDDFRSPIVIGMARSKPRERDRERILTDDEIRAVWKAAEAGQGVFDRYVQFLLLTATRRGESADLARPEIDGTEWTIPAARYKTKIDFVVPLSAKAVDVLGKIPAIKGCDYVFTTDGENPISGFSKFKADFDERCNVTDWTLHDLRRTARSLMSRAGVSADHAERCLGHIIGGVRGVYDRHEYLEEKRKAFAALAAQLERVLNPADNVVPFVAEKA